MSTRISLIVHGGAGDIPERERPDHIEGLTRALDAGFAVLREGLPALDAVETAVRILEEAPAFDAGVGSVLRLDGSVSLDASIMEGTGRQAGAVACVSRVRAPITLARLVLERTRHVLVMGEGAERLAEEAGFELVEPEFFVTERERKRLERILRREARRAADAEDGPRGTVGAVARDARGAIAAATSTGGAPGAIPGRVGDSPIIGAGTFADDRYGGVSCTGSGEHILRATLAREVVRRLERGDPAGEVAAWGIDHLHRETGGQGGLICLDRNGQCGACHNTGWMGSLWRSEEPGLDSR